MKKTTYRTRFSCKNIAIRSGCLPLALNLQQMWLTLSRQCRT